MRAFAAFVLLLALAVAALALSPGAAVAATGPCPDGRDGAGWTLATTSSTTPSRAIPYVGNGYLGQRVPPAAWATSRPARDRLAAVHARYDGAFVAGLYGADP